MDSVCWRPKSDPTVTHPPYALHTLCTHIFFGLIVILPVSGLVVAWVKLDPNVEMGSVHDPHMPYQGVARLKSPDWMNEMGV